MKNKKFGKFYLFSCIGVLLASYYPLSMGARVVCDMIRQGSVLKENYPKYIIPYTPICLAVIAGVLLMPLCMKFLKKFAFAGGALAGTGVFLASELFLEQKVVVSSVETVSKLGDWQMYMCYLPPDGYSTEYKIQTPIDILIGNYNPAFKLHFYIISVVLIVTVLNCLYGFGQMIKSGEKKRLTSLILQSCCSLAFLGLCILACFTAFWRDGSLQVSSLSATLMTMFFVLLGVTVGVFAGSFLLGKRKFVSVVIPAIVSSAMTLLMYIGEMILLHGHLYIFGTGFIFRGIPGIILAPIDIFVILLSGVITAFMLLLLNGNSEHPENGGRMKKTGIIVALSLIGAAVAAALIVSVCNSGNQRFPAKGAGILRIVETTSGQEESSYQIEAAVGGRSFPAPGQVLADKIAEAWQEYDSLTEEQKALSSKLWEIVDIQAETWEECEEYLGVSLENPLEAFKWLNKSGYFGNASADPVPHVWATVHTVRRNINQIDVTAGYNTGKINVTLTASVFSGWGFQTMGSARNGCFSYKPISSYTGSGIPVLIVTESSLNGDCDFLGSTAYWVYDKALYCLRVWEEDCNSNESRATLQRILREL